MIAIIPARGGSKGLPGKNIKSLNGKPLIAYTIEAALRSSCVSRVIVSTDDPEIARISLLYGAEVPFMRPPELATDNSNAIDTYLYTIKRLEQDQETLIDSIMVLLPTCPLRTSEDIDISYKIYKSKKSDSLISYTKENHPISWHKYISDDGGFVDIILDTKIANRQEYRPSYYPNGAIYIFSKELLESGEYYSENSFSYIMPRERSVDIDTLEDFKYVEFLLRDSGNEKTKL